MDIQHHPDARRFIATVDGVQGEVAYDLDGREMVVTHTRVPAAIEGRGVASAMTRAVFDHARAEGLKVRPLCSYAAAWAQRHEEYGDVMSPDA